MPLSMRTNVTSLPKSLTLKIRFSFVDKLPNIWEVQPYHIITDREKAVRTAIEHASGSDVVILAGNGDAKHQRVNGKLVYYPSDLAIAKEYATY